MVDVDGMMSVPVAKVLAEDLPAHIEAASHPSRRQKWDGVAL